mgnify:CR=1 FL=1
MALIELDELPGDELPSEERTEVQPVVKAEAPEIPDKYRGKSLEDIVKMHQEAEKLIGKQAQEVGEVRKLADELLKQQLSKKEEAPTEEDNDIDFFEDPKKAVTKAVEKHPDVVAAKEAAQRMRAMELQAKLKSKHSDMEQVVSNPEFVEWIKASPTRIRLYQQADAQFDLDAADELLSTYKELRTVKAQQNKSDGAELRNQNLRAAAVDAGGTGETSRKIYRREDLIRLRITDPTRYEALQPEIMAAYAEGRVK